MEQKENELRLRDLRGWHLLTASCGRCGHHSQLDVRFLPGRTAETVTDIERRLICSNCGNHRTNRLIIAMAPR